MLFGDPDPKILDAHEGLVLVFRDTYQHRVCLGRILDRIIQEVNQHLPNAVSIPTHLGPDLPLKQQAMRLCRPLDVFHDLLYQRIHLKAFFPVVELACLHLGKIE